MFKNITLEVSLKPFKKTDIESIRAVVSEIFDGWRPLLIGREVISIMLWAADGSELLEWNGNYGESFEWARFVGTANNETLGDDEPKETSLHQKRQEYMENPPVMTYGILRDIISAIKEEGKKKFPTAKIRVGETFDIGPEFAISDFKYRRHREITVASAGFKRHGFIDATEVLHADGKSYAGFPHGIPEGTPFGIFFGRQSECFLGDMGFDYIWLSNGLGFSSNPWDLTGKIFDGERFYPEKLGATSSRVLGFWEMFRSECHFPIETRGTNNSVGIDYATDGVPLHTIYNKDLGITAPPNSPWAAINDNFGLELMGHLTRVCELPSDIFPFRYYLHDPWWINSPWYDRYDGSPSDIYLPMSLSRITGEGKIESANSFAILSIDNSYGDMPKACINEPLPHILKAEKDAPDKPAPLVWVYPLREYSTSSDGAELARMYYGDKYISEAINSGFPLSSVISTDNFLKCPEGIFRDSILVSPVPVSEKIKEKLQSTASLGVIVYGSSDELFGLSDKFVKVDRGGEPQEMLTALASFGYEISFEKKNPAAKSPTLTLFRRDGALMLSAYNPNTATDTLIRTPIGAPLFIGMETEIRDGRSVIRLARGEHRECRVFAEQKSGVISVREAVPGNTRYRRTIAIRGLDDATVRVFTELGCEFIVSHAKGAYHTAVEDTRFVKKCDALGNEYLEGVGITGDITLQIGHRK